MWRKRKKPGEGGICPEKHQKPGTKTPTEKGQRKKNVSRARGRERREKLGRWFMKKREGEGTSLGRDKN